MTHPPQPTGEGIRETEIFLEIATGLVVIALISFGIAVGYIWGTS